MPVWIVSFARWAAVTVALGVTFAWFGVYETSQIPFPERIVYWTGLMAVGVASAVFVSPLVYYRWMSKSHPAIQIAVIAALISVPITLGLAAIQAIGGNAVSPSWWAVQYGYAIVISALLTTGAWVIDRLVQKPAATMPGAAAAQASPFADRLPVKFRAGEVYAVSAEDHYLRVHTSVGETMILMRLADAVRELAGLGGLQTHRSWWVAKQGLADVVRGDGKLVLKLKSGAEAPVSRTYLKAVREAGWL